MRALLRDLPAGLPADALRTRIRGRRSHLLRDWDRLLLAPVPLAGLAPAPWRPDPSGAPDWTRQALQAEFYWTFAHLEEGLRRTLAPIFWLEEVRTLALGLRLLARGKADFAPLLRFSLLATPLRTLLHQAESCAAAVAGLTTLLTDFDPHFAGLNEIFRSAGHGPLETALYERSLQRLSASRLHPQLRTCIALLIDSRNLTIVAKQLRWQLAPLPPLLEGGHLPRWRLEEVFARRDRDGLLQLTRRLGGQGSAAASDDPEQLLCAAQTRVLRRLGRDDAGVGVILDYLWRCRNEAANLGLLARLETAGSAAIARELRR